MNENATIINYCSNEYQFLKPCLEQAACFSDQIIVVVCDHFFDGKEENLDELKKTFAEFTNCQFILYPYSQKLTKHPIYKKINSPSFWHSLSRFIGFSFVKPTIDYIFFIDADEITDGKRVKEWLKAFNYQDYNALRLLTYWYFRETKYQATTWEDGILLARKSQITPSALIQKGERLALFNSIASPKLTNVLSQDEMPLSHHYSWVRSKEEMLRKVSSWGHTADRDWKKLVEQEFSHEFSGKDFVHGYAFKTVKPFVKLEMHKPQNHMRIQPNNVKYLNEKELLQLLYPNILHRLLTQFFSM